MTSLSAKARKVIWFVDITIIVIENESVKKAYLQWKNDNKYLNEGSQKYCVFINDNNISNTLKFVSRFTCLCFFMKCLPAIKCLCSTTS